MIHSRLPVSELIMTDVDNESLNLAARLEGLSLSRQLGKQSKTAGFTPEACQSPFTNLASYCDLVYQQHLVKYDTKASPAGYNLHPTHKGESILRESPFLDRRALHITTPRCVFWCKNKTCCSKNINHLKIGAQPLIVCVPNWRLSHKDSEKIIGHVYMGCITYLISSAPLNWFLNGIRHSTLSLPEKTTGSYRDKGTTFLGSCAHNVYVSCVQLLLAWTVFLHI